MFAHSTALKPSYLFAPASTGAGAAAIRELADKPLLGNIATAAAPSNAMLTSVMNPE
jgi:hypothetical protein